MLPQAGGGAVLQVLLGQGAVNPGDAGDGDRARHRMVDRYHVVAVLKLWVGTQPFGIEYRRSRHTSRLQGVHDLGRRAPDGPALNECVQSLFVRLPTRLISEAGVNEPLAVFEGLTQGTPLVFVIHGDCRPAIVAGT